MRSCAYLNNIVGQDHRRVNTRTGPMLGFKRFANVSIVISGIELVAKLRKGQFNVARLIKRASGTRVPAWTTRRPSRKPVHKQCSEGIPLMPMVKIGCAPANCKGRS